MATSTTDSNTTTTGTKPKTAKVTKSRKPAPAKPAAAKPAFEWPEGTKPRDLLVEFLVERCSPDQDAPAQGRPYISGDRMFTHGSWWIEWVSKKVGVEVPTRTALAVLKDAGLTAREMHFKQLGRAMAMYVGAPPAGTTNIARRVVERTGGGPRPAPSEQAAKLAEQLVRHASAKLKDMSAEERAYIVRRLARELSATK